MLVLVGKVEVVIIGIAEEESSNDEVEKGSRRALVEVLGLVPANDARGLLGSRSLTTGKSLVKVNNVNHSLSVGGSTNVL